MNKKNKINFCVLLLLSLLLLCTSCNDKDLFVNKNSRLDKQNEMLVKLEDKYHNNRIELNEGIYCYNYSEKIYKDNKLISDVENNIYVYAIKDSNSKLSSFSYLYQTKTTTIYNNNGVENCKKEIEYFDGERYLIHTEKENDTHTKGFSAVNKYINLDFASIDKDLFNIKYLKENFNNNLSSNKIITVREKSNSIYSIDLVIEEHEKNIKNITLTEELKLDDNLMFLSYSESIITQTYGNDEQIKYETAYIEKLDDVSVLPTFEYDINNVEMCEKIEIKTI